MYLQGDKRREGPNSAGPNEIVACTSCAGDGSPCTHTASNRNGCATEVTLYFNGTFSRKYFHVFKLRKICPQEKIGLTTEIDRFNHQQKSILISQYPIK